eukprot:537546-Pleurochrysis_carterae.AAC.2
MAANANEARTAAAVRTAAPPPARSLFEGKKLVGRTLGIQSRHAGCSANEASTSVQRQWT